MTDLLRGSDRPGCSARSPPQATVLLSTVPSDPRVSGRSSKSIGHFIGSHPMNSLIILSPRTPSASAPLPPPPNPLAKERAGERIPVSWRDHGCARVLDEPQSALRAGEVHQR